VTPHDVAKADDVDDAEDTDDPTSRDARPAVSVVVPAYNREATVEHTVRSVLAAIDRLDAPLAGEVVVVDDGSIDDTAARAARLAADDPRVHVVWQENAGVSAARNAGARAARGDVLAFLDCDDQVDADWLVELLGVAATGFPGGSTSGAHTSDGAARPDFAFCQGRRVRADRIDVRPLRPLGPAFGHVTGIFQPGLFTVDRSLFLDAGGYAVALTFSESTELGLRLTAHVERQGRAVTARVIAKPLVQMDIPDVPGSSNAYSDRRRYESALYIIDAHGPRLSLDPALLATYWAIAGVAAARLDRGSDAARCFARAARLQPRRPRHLARALAACVPTLRHRIWPPRTHANATPRSARVFDRARGRSPLQLALAVLRRARRLVVRSRREPGKPSTAWARTEANPRDAEVLDTFRLFAVLGTWCEADVIEATVRNAFAQGCERVYLIDNDSPDDTVERAVAAGAVLAESFATDAYDESLRMKIMNDVVARVSAETASAEDTAHIWWLWLDADEFHHGPHGRTVADYLATLDRRFRVVGGRFFNHYPDRMPEYVEGRHPLDFQPMCEEQVYPMCADGHRKHPLQRWDRHADPITCSAGFHQASCDTEPLLEPALPIYVHHFPYRVESVSRHRLDLLCDSEGGRATEISDANWHIQKRHRSFDAVYRRRWKRVERVALSGPKTGVVLRPWAEQVPSVDTDYARWY